MWKFLIHPMNRSLHIAAFIYQIKQEQKLGKSTRHINPIWIGLFANLKRLGGGICPHPLITWLFQVRKRWNLVRQRSLQIDKFFYDVIVMLILWVEIFTNWQNFWWHHRHVDFMTSSKWDSWKNSTFFNVVAEYLKNYSTDFHQTYVTFRQVYTDVFENKRWKIDHSLLKW